MHLGGSADQVLSLFTGEEPSHKIHQIYLKHLLTRMLKRLFKVFSVNLNIKLHFLTPIHVGCILCSCDVFAFQSLPL